MEMKDGWKRFRESIRARHIYCTLTIALVALTVFSLAQLKRANDYKLAVENQYNRSFHELVDYVRDIDMSLAKGLLVKSPQQLTILSTDIWREASAAQANLGQLPVSQYQLDNTEKFLSQVGDYCYMLSKKAAAQQELSQAEYDQMTELAKFSATLYESLQNMQNDIYSGTITFAELENASARAGNVSADEGFGAQLAAVEKEFQDYPSLIYDGPFSSHLENMEPLTLRGLPDVSEEQARAAAISFLGQDQTYDLQATTGNAGVVETYSFTAPGGSQNEGIAIDVTKKGGQVLWMTNNRAIDLSDEIPMEQAVEKAREFLQRVGHPNVKNSYYQKSGGSATINFAYYKDGVTYYPDLIKVKVALDNGEIVGYESRGYTMRHNDARQLGTVQLTEEQARERLNANLMVQNVNLAVIPKENMEEVLCYEFQGKSNDRNFIVYINAETGDEEEILILLENQDGVLTM